MIWGLGEKLKELFRGKTGTAEFFDELEDTLIEADVGAAEVMKITSELREEAKKDGAKTKEAILELLRRRLGELVRFEPLAPDPSRLNVFLVLGVNGAGKTTTIAKLAQYYRGAGVAGIVLAAGDTFRAGAIDQLALHGKRLGVRVVSQDPGADPGAVIFDAIESASARGEKLVLADSAGRLHNKENLVRELQKIDKVIRNKAGEKASYRKILVIDAGTGQNGLAQAKVFHEAVGVDSVILTKFDGAARGGIVVAIARELGIPISFLGVGEKMTDLIPGGRDEYLSGLLGDV
ncbi:MAG: signal recognition particle-docking protein FtsY [Spirochaetales bacterium]|jgi:fused signal recognition particle receptor|nr:signal recognition particle-docking protein FtsY [Spirochaetales bacterium]